ncbi:hypothetical protein CLU93_5475 [Janthinobacterium sp. 35]|uniref:hypothetical protein n=1 Tax=Janthinobacterium sp. 35 TaxID=2035210 RepID=UPI000C199B81|nr:hypothetical protein [Janthinobacterium sp. 35]PIG25835.1 hypothetical protein CLU93_0019 [Janthinobacterium sp. 35]PIG31122.1 hypothetical protein CLU93_5475 [Janthinobacterium sp. 35]
MNNNASIDALEQGGPLSVAVTAQRLAVQDGWKLVPVEPTPEIIAGAAIASWPTATLADIDLARQAAPIVLMQMNMAPGTTVDALAGMLATMAPAYRAMIAAAPAPPSVHIVGKDATVVGACAEMCALCSACGGTGDVHGLDGEWRGQCTCVHAWQQRAEKAEADLKQVNEWRAAALTESQTLGELWASKVEQAEARVKELQAELDIELERAYDRLLAARTNKQADRQVLQADGRHPAPCARDCEAPAFKNQVRERDARIAQLEARLVRRRAPLSPEAQQAIAAARAAGQTIAATPGGLVFLNSGAEPGSGELDCPACGGSGHAGDLPAGSAP